MDTCCWCQIALSICVPQDPQIELCFSVFSDICRWPTAEKADMLLCCCVLSSPQDSMCCVFWDAPLLAAVLKGGYQSYHSLLLSSSESDHSPLTSLIKVFQSTVAQRAIFFSTHFWVKTPETVVNENPRRSTVSEILRYQGPCHSDSHWNYIFVPAVMFDVNIKWKPGLISIIVCTSLLPNDGWYNKV